MLSICGLFSTRRLIQRLAGDYIGRSAGMSHALLPACDTAETHCEEFFFTARELAMMDGCDMLLYDVALGHTWGAELECYKNWIGDFSEGSRYWHYFRDRFDLSGLTTVTHCRNVFEGLLHKTAWPSKARLALLKRPMCAIRRVGHLFLHVDDQLPRVPYSEVLRFLREIDYGDMLVGMSAADLIAQAKVANASTMAAGIASAAFIAEHAATKKINITMRATDRELLGRTVGFNAIYDPKRDVSGDHTVVYMCREFVRQDYDKMCSATNTKSKTLVVGSSWREVSRYAANPMIDHYFFGGDAKDAVRITVQALEKVKKIKWHTMDKKQRETMRKAGEIGHEAQQQVVTNSPRVRTYLTMSDMLIKAKEAEEIPARFLFDIPDHRYSAHNTYTTLLFEDVGYNFSEKNWLEAFRRTNAQVGYGYMMLPYELVFPKLPKNRLYRYHEQEQRYWQGYDKPHAGHYMHSDYSSATGYFTTTVASVTYNHANGYMHPKSAWSLLLRKGILSASGYDFGLEVELTSRYGPMVGFTLTRVNTSTSVVRTIALPPEMQYLQLMDLVDMATRLKKNPKHVLVDPFPYFSVRKSEFDATVNYLLSLDVKSLTVTNAITFVRRNVSGASLVSKELIQAWDLDHSDINRFALTVYHHTVMLRHLAGDEVSDIIQISIDWRDKISNSLKRIVKGVIQPFTFLWSWLWTDRLTDKLVLSMEGELYQTDNITLKGDRWTSKLTGRAMFDKGFSTGPQHGTISSAHVEDDLVGDYQRDKEEYQLDPSRNLFKQVVGEDGILPTGVSYVDIDFAGCIEEDKNPLLEFLSAGGKLRDDVDLRKAYTEYSRWRARTMDDSCDVCGALHGKTGEQIVECMNADGPTTHSFALSQTDLDNLRNGLISMAQETPDILGKVLLECRENLPQTAFSTDVEVEYIKGGPGCGKSYIIRTLADKDLDLIACPYLKVRSDYQNVKDADGCLYSYNFQTQHKMMCQSGKLVVFVDEFTAMDYSLLACLLYRCGTKRVYLVGDELQTGIQEGSGEGVNIMNRVCLAEMRTHIPVVNFRNPRNIVSLLNHLYGYRMLPANTENIPIVFGDTKDFNDYNNHTFMHYSWGTAETLRDTPDHSGKTSVRCNQGSTWQDVVLPVTESDRNLIVVDPLNIVALSRHKGTLTMLLEGGVDNPAPTSAALRSLVSDVPEEVWRDDYNLQLYLGLLDSRSIAAAPIESEMLLSFRELVLHYDGYVAYDVQPAIVYRKFETDVIPQEPFDSNIRATPVGLPIEDVPVYVASSQHVLVNTTHDEDWDDLLAGRVGDEPEPEYKSREGDTLLPALADCAAITYHELIKMVLRTKAGKDFMTGWFLRSDDGEDEDVSLLARFMSSVIVVQEIKDGVATSSPRVYASLGGTRVLNLVRDKGSGYVNDVSMTVRRNELSEDKKEVPPVGLVNTSWFGTAKREGHNRPNNCLLTALAGSLEITTKELDKQMLNGDRYDYYKRWVKSSRMSDELDCLAFARILKKHIVVVHMDNELSYNSYGSRDHSTVIIQHLKRELHYASVDRNDHKNLYAGFLGQSPKVTSASCLTHKIKFGETADSLINGYNTSVESATALNKGEFAVGENYMVEPSDSVVFRTISGHHMGGAECTDVVLRERDPEVIDRLENKHGLRPGFHDYATEFIVNVVTTSEEVKRCFETSVVYPKMCRPARDSHLLTSYFDLDPGPLEYNLDYLNQECDAVVGDKFVSGTIDTEMLCPVNMRGHPVVSTVTYHALTIGPANQYFKKNEWQTLKVMQSRYLAKKTSQHMTVNGVNTAKYIGDLFVSECLSINYEDTFNDESICSIVDRALQSMVQKNYQKQMDENFTDGARVYRFSLKDIAKPIKETIDINKAGQGISAWSKIAQVKFMVAHRVINDILIKAVKPNVVYDNSFTEEEFLDLANTALAATPGTAVNGVIDATACDSGQNRFTMEIERTIMSAMGISEMFLDWYFLHRQSYILQSGYIRARVSNVKTSGEPATLFGNTILMASIMNALLRGEGPWAMMMKGDDGIKRQSNLAFNRALLKEIRCHCDLDFKVDIGVPIQFCGYALEKGMLVSCVIRKLMKIAAHKFRDYEHFKEYQISLRDWLKRVPTEQPGWAVYLKVNAQVIDTTPDVIECLMDQISCFSHIGRAEFLRLFRLRTVSMSETIEGLSTKVFNAKSTKFNTPFMASICESI